MEYKNSQILAAVVSEWARPAISQIAAGNLMRLPMLQSLQATISSLCPTEGHRATHPANHQFARRTYACPIFRSDTRREHTADGT